MKMRLAAFLRRLADRLAPVQYGPWTNVTMNFTPPAGYDTAIPYVCGSPNSTQFVVANRLEFGEGGWTVNP